MSKLLYSPITSLDGYVNDAAGTFDWAAPDNEVHAFVNELERSVGTYLFGRRMYETMVFWETADAIAGQPAVARDFTTLWKAADKVVYSSTLASLSSALPGAGRGGRRHAGPPRRRPPDAGAPRSALFPLRHGLPALPGGDVRATTHPRR